MTEREIRLKVRCGCCRGKLGKRLNLVQLERKATWEYPTCGNVITGEEGQACAILCDRCVELCGGTPEGALPDADGRIVEAVEFRAGQVVYHPVDELEKIEMVKEPRPEPEN